MPSKLVNNDYMGWGPDSARHRDGLLKLMARLKANKVSVHLRIGRRDSALMPNFIAFPAQGALPRSD
jgi:hypothetical protein